MSNAHITAVRRCNRFKGNARLLLMILADAASNGEKVTKGGFYNLPLGWTSKGEEQLMKDMNIKRRQTITDLIAELEHAGAIIRKQLLRKNAMTFVDIAWLKKNAWPSDKPASTPEATESEASGNESSGSVTRAGSDPEVYNGKRAICATESVASKMPRKALRDTTESVATSTPVFDPVVDTPAPVGEITRSPVKTDEEANLALLDAPQVWQEPEAKAAPKAKPELRPERPAYGHEFDSGWRSATVKCRHCQLSQREYFCSGGANNPANTCPPLPCDRSTLCAECGAERGLTGQCIPCWERKREERRRAKEAAKVGALVPLSTAQVAELLSAYKVTEQLSDL
ncbi:MAG: hypothetical protein WB919_08145 [Candidatus Sulfotelmatobacter sp.]